MSAIGTGSSRKPNSVQAVEEALQQARMKVQGFVDWGLVFFSAEHLDRRLRRFDKSWLRIHLEPNGPVAVQAAYFLTMGKLLGNQVLSYYWPRPQKSEPIPLQPASVESILLVWLTNFVNFLKG